MKLYLFDDDSIHNVNDFYDKVKDLLDIELNIANKKKNNIPLDDFEKFFDFYLIKPSTMIRLFSIIGNKKN